MTDIKVGFGTNGTVLLIAVFVVALLPASEETKGLTPKDSGQIDH